LSPHFTLGLSSPQSPLSSGPAILTAKILSILSKFFTPNLLSATTSAISGKKSLIRAIRSIPCRALRFAPCRGFLFSSAFPQKKLVVSLCFGVFVAKFAVTLYFLFVVADDLRFSPYPKRGIKKRAKIIKKRAFLVVFPSRPCVFREKS
jgi:hypothetical protein